jgi:hypothetical protein
MNGHNRTQWVLIAIEQFVVVTAIYGALLVVPTLPTDWLAGSVFDSYLVPALSLGVLVGGSAFLAATLLVFAHHYGPLAALASGIALMIWIGVQVAVVPESHPLQPFYFGVGLLEAVLALVLGAADPLTRPHGAALGHR